MVLSKLGGKSIGESSVEVTRIAEVARVSISVFDFLSFCIRIPTVKLKILGKLFLKSNPDLLLHSSYSF